MTFIFNVFVKNDQSLTRETVVFSPFTSRDKEDFAVDGFMDLWKGDNF